MKIQVASDLHIESTPDESLRGLVEIDEDNKPDVLVMAGDICSWRLKESTKSDLLQYCLNTIPILYIPGNHEYYGCPRKDADKARDMYLKLFNDSRIRCLDRGVEEFYTNGERVVFICATLWTDLSNPIDEMRVVRGLNDFEFGLTSTWYKDQYELSKGFIRYNLELYDSSWKKVVVTHHAPSERSIHEKYKTSFINRGFYSPLDDLLEGTNAPCLWIHGHTHGSLDYQAGNTRVICNPHGYSYKSVLSSHPSENAEGYNPSLVVDI